MTFTETTADGGASSGGGIGEAMAELVMQPHVVPIGGGGGGCNDRDWNDEDKEKNKKNPYKRRR